MATSSNITFKEQMDGFPWTQIIVIACIRFAEPIAFTSLFTYVYFMVEDFGIANTDAEISTYAGYLSAAFAFCQVLTSVQYGTLADKFGRKPTVLLGLIGSIVSLLLFGFARSYTWAIVARSLMGLLNGNITVLRTVLGEVTPERKHQSMAFATMPLVFQMGAVIGPLVGGYMSGKETRVGFLKDFVAKFPYALPNIFIAFMLLGGCLIAIFFLEETHYKYKYRRDPFVEMGDRFLTARFGISPKIRPWNDKMEQAMALNESSSFQDSPSLAAEEFEMEDQSSKKSETHTTTRPLFDEDDDQAPVSMSVLVKSPPIFFAISSNFLISLHAVVNDEFFPIFLSQKIEKDQSGNLLSQFPFKIVGGLSFTSKDTGALLSTTGLIGVFLIVLVLPYLSRNFDAITLLKYLNYVYPPIYFVIPYLAFLADHPTWARVSAYGLQVIRSITMALSFPQLYVIAHNSCHPRCRALVNGLTISSGSLARCIGPFIWGYFMSWGQQWNIAWLGWWLLVLLTVLNIYYARYLKDVDAERESSQSSSLNGEEHERED